MPRFIMVLLWLFSDYLSEAYGTWVWPLIGFFILPTTTLCYAVAVQELDGFTGWGAALDDPRPVGRPGRVGSRPRGLQGLTRIRVRPPDDRRPGPCSEPHRDPR